MKRLGFNTVPLIAKEGLLWTLHDFWEFLLGLEQAVSTLPRNLEQN